MPTFPHNSGRQLFLYFGPCLSPTPSPQPPCRTSDRGWGWKKYQTMRGTEVFVGWGGRARAALPFLHALCYANACWHMTSQFSDDRTKDLRTCCSVCRGRLPIPPGRLSGENNRETASRRDARLACTLRHLYLCACVCCLQRLRGVILRWVSRDILVNISICVHPRRHAHTRIKS